MATVLIVEDEDVLRETLSSFLTRQGHDVIAAASGHEALEIGLDASSIVGQSWCSSGTGSCGSCWWRRSSGPGRCVTRATI